MKVNDVEISNWYAPGDSWWEMVQQYPDSERIEATLKMTLSWNEYKDLLDRSKVVNLRPAPST